MVEIDHAAKPFSAVNWFIAYASRVNWLRQLIPYTPMISLTMIIYKIFSAYNEGFSAGTGSRLA
jgi:hypothetical protein